MACDGFVLTSRCWVWAYFAEANVAEGGNGRSKSKKLLLHVLNPSYDYVPPELISLFVTGKILLSVETFSSHLCQVFHHLLAISSILATQLTRNYFLQIMAMGLCHHTSTGN
jgi:hypothetical protein